MESSMILEILYAWTHIVSTKRIFIVLWLWETEI